MIAKKRNGGSYAMPHIFAKPEKQATKNEISNTGCYERKADNRQKWRPMSMSATDLELDDDESHICLIIHVQYQILHEGGGGTQGRK